jgi:hypothetical protein
MDLDPGPRASGNIPPLRWRSNRRRNSPPSARARRIGVDKNRLTTHKRERRPWILRSKASGTLDTPAGSPKINQAYASKGKALPDN